MNAFWNKLIKSSNDYVLNMDYAMNKPIPSKQDITIKINKKGATHCTEKYTITFPDGQEVDVDVNKMTEIKININESGKAKIVCWMDMRHGSFEVI